MALEDSKPLNLDDLSDEDFMKLDPTNLEEVIDNPVEIKDEPEDNDSDEVKDSVETTDLDDSDNEQDQEDDSDDSKDPDQEKEVQTEEKGSRVSNPKVVEKEEEQENLDPKLTKSSKEDAEKEPVKATVKPSSAEDFFNKVTAPFKADGRDMQVRTPEDVIKLMQMGTNYSRRMQELKPLRQMDAMLKEHGLDTETLSYLIDIKNGKPEAIQKLLKDAKIDPLDIDTNTTSTYVPSNKAGDPKDLAFQDAIETTLNTEGGQTIINDINAHWDDSSKDALREHPEIFSALMDQKTSGQYEKINTELQYQRTMGYLTNVPFLQAYQAVGDAMQKAGVFGTTKDQNHSTGMAPVKRPGATPIDTGPRKVVSKPKTKQPNPDVSSVSSPRAVPNPKGTESQPDYSSMSDNDFLKLALPD